MNRKSFEKKITRSTARAINESKKEQPTVQAVSTNKRKLKETNGIKSTNGILPSINVSSHSADAPSPSVDVHSPNIDVDVHSTSYINPSAASIGAPSTSSVHWLITQRKITRHKSLPSLAATAANATTTNAAATNETKEQIRQTNKTIKLKKFNYESSSEEEIEITPFLPGKSKRIEFEKWSLGRLEALEAKIDKLAFINFLKEIDNLNEIQEYVKNYLGDSATATQFGSDFYNKINENEMRPNGFCFTCNTRAKIDMLRCNYCNETFVLKD